MARQVLFLFEICSGVENVFLERTGTEGEELELWSSDLLVVKKRQKRDDTLVKVLQFMNEHDREAWESLDEAVQARLVSDDITPVEDEEKPFAERKYTTPAKYREPCSNKPLNEHSF